MVRLPGVDSTQMCRMDHCLLQLVEGSLMHSSPLSFEICFEHRGARSSYNLESFDKLLVQSTETDKLSNFMDGGLSRPTLNSLDVSGVHVYSILINDVSAKRNSGAEGR